MSTGNRIAKAYLRRWYQPRLSNASLETILWLRKGNRPLPPRRVASRHSVREQQIGGVRCVWLDRARADNGVLIYLHGGAYLFGPVKEQWRWLSLIARRAGMAALMVDYRLAPEHPFPAGFDDVLAVLGALRADEGLPAGGWCLAGDSAGGGLAVSVTQELVSRGEPLPQRLLLMSPWLDLTMGNPAVDEQLIAADPFLWYEGTKLAGLTYSGGEDPRHPRISPIFGAKEGLPQTMLHAGSHEILLWDIRKFYVECREAGVNATYREYHESFHVFMMAAMLPEARRAIREQVAFLKSRAD